MRLYAPLLASVLLALPLAGHAQILVRPLSAQQRIELDQCLKQAGEDREAARACWRKMEDAEPDKAIPEQPQVPPTEQPPVIEPAPETVPPPATTEPRQEGEPTPTETQTPPPPQEDQRTQAERDFDALYGDEDYGDPNLPTPAASSPVYDPWEPYNRQMHRFNNAIDRGVARPLARGYVKVVPRPFRLGVSNFFNNLGQPVSAVNALLQGKPKQAGQSLGRFVLNSTLGIGGIFDPASDAKLPNKSEDFGQTLGLWGWKNSRYFELPLFGPRTLRDTFGMVGDAPLSPLRQVEADSTRIPLQGLQLVDVRAQLLATDSFREGAEDDYALVRDAWIQRRDYQIFGDRMENQDEMLPDYLQDDSNPQVPVDAMPVMPPEGGR